TAWMTARSAPAPTPAPRAKPYRNDPTRGNGNSPATGNDVPRTGEQRPTPDGDNRGGTTDTIRRSPTATTPDDTAGARQDAHPQARDMSSVCQATTGNFLGSGVRGRS